jgi:hypothetical protein
MTRSPIGWDRRIAGAAGALMLGWMMGGGPGDDRARAALRAISAGAASDAPVTEPAVAPVPDPGDDPLRVEVLTFGPGTHPFTRFGHNAIRIVDRRLGTDVVYNFGTFSFDSPRLVWEFLQGRLRYWLSRSSMATTVRVYRRENRSIEAQELDLSRAQKQALAERLEINARPENRHYRYDYFADNCSTRVRDAVDAVLGGNLHGGAVEPGSMSLREHALRMSADNLPLYTALLIALGPATDEPIDEWAEAFLPELLQRTLGRAVIGPDEAGVPARPLVKSQQVLLAANRSAARREPPEWHAAFLGAGLLVGLVMALLGRAGARVRGVRVVFGVFVSVAGLVVGGIGCFLVGVWTFTPHAVAYRNENVLLLAPFTISLVVLGLGSATGGRAAARWTHRITACALGLALAGCFAKLLPSSRQQNGAVIAFMLPVWVGITAGARSVARRLQDPPT